MKNSKFKEFLKKNTNMLLTICGIMIIAVAVMMIVNNSVEAPDPDSQIDLNEADNNGETENNQAQGENDQSGGQIAENEQQNQEVGQANPTQSAAEPTPVDSLVGEDEPLDLESEVADTEGVKDNETALTDDPPKEVAEQPEDTTPNEEATVETSAGSTIAEKTEEDKAQEAMARIASLKYDESMGLRWPVEGKIVMEYSDDHLIYHETLDQFRTHPAVAIAAEEGMDVMAAADGVVTAIEEKNQVGMTVTTAIGNDYYLVYGQLAKCDLQVGDEVKVGDVIGTIGKTTHFYTVEGNNLYFQVLCGDEPVNPMSLLQNTASEEVEQETDTTAP